MAWPSILGLSDCRKRVLVVCTAKRSSHILPGKLRQAVKLALMDSKLLPTSRGFFSSSNLDLSLSVLISVTGTCHLAQTNCHHRSLSTPGISGLHPPGTRHPYPPFPRSAASQRDSLRRRFQCHFAYSRQVILWVSNVSTS